MIQPSFFTLSSMLPKYSQPEFLTVEGEEDFTTCCDVHDACYATCGISKDHCENDFKRCMQRMCKEIFTSNSKCESATETYVMGTTAFGGGGFEVCMLILFSLYLVFNIWFLIALFSWDCVCIELVAHLFVICHLIRHFICFPFVIT